MELGHRTVQLRRHRRDPVERMKHIDVMNLFNADPETDAVIMVGEDRRPRTKRPRRCGEDNMKKPVVGFIAGVTAPAASAWATPGPSSPAATGTGAGEAGGDAGLRHQGDAQSGEMARR